MRLFPDPADYPENRFFALDFLRGVDMLVLIAWAAIGHAIGTACRLGPGFMSMFEHPWIGFTLWDFIHPLFMFVVGAALPLAMLKRLEDGRARGVYWRHVLVRIAMLWVLGGLVQCRWLTFDPMLMTPYGNTLQTIAVGYFFGALVLPLKSRFWRCFWPVAAAFLHGTVVHFGGDYTQSGCWACRFDVAVWRWMLPAGHAAIDIDGWVRYATTPMYFFLVACGMEATRILAEPGRSPWRKAGLLTAVGSVLSLAGVFFHLWIPYMKHIFSMSFSFLTMGLCFLLLAATYVVTDIWKFRRGTGIVLLWGQCSLAAYVVGSMFPEAFMSVSRTCLAGLPRILGQSPLVEILYAVGAMVAMTFFLGLWRLGRGLKRVDANRYL